MKNAFGVPALLLFSAMTGFGSLAHENGFSLLMAGMSTALIWGLPGQAVHAELFGLGAPVAAVALAVAGANARFLPMTLSMMPVFQDSPHDRRWHYLLAHFISINTWGEMMFRGPEIAPNRRVAYYLGFSSICMAAGEIGVVQGYLLSGALPVTVTVGLIFLVPVYFGLIMSNTDHLPFLLAFFLGCLAGPLLHKLIPEWNLAASGLISGTLAFVLRKRISSKQKTSPVNDNA